LPTVCGIDSSTQSTKVQLRDAETGAVLAQARQAHPPTSPPRSEQDPEAWWRALRQGLDQVGQRLGTPDALSVAGQQHGMVALGPDGEVLRPAKLWNDTEAAADAAALVDQLGTASWVSRTGSVPGPAFTVAKLAWLARCEPAIHARVTNVVLPHDWLTWRLTGAMVTDRGDASGTGYFSPTDNRWDTELLALVGLGPEVPPRLCSAEEPVGQWRGAVVGPGTGDNMAAALGAALQPGDVAISIGTSGTVYALSDRPSADESGAVAGFADALGRYLPLVCTLNATKVTDSVRGLLGVEPERFDALCLSSPPGAGGLVLLPYFDGERTPNLPDATGQLLGIRSGVSPESVARAAVEGVICGLLDGLDALTMAGVTTQGGRLLLLGGGARSGAFCQVLAHLAQRTVTVPDNAELVAAGAAVLAEVARSGADAAAVARAWNLGTGGTVDPGPDGDPGAVRQAFSEARQRAYGPPGHEGGALRR
jgi:xylulokinase